MPTGVSPSTLSLALTGMRRAQMTALAVVRDLNTNGGPTIDQVVGLNTALIHHAANAAVVKVQAAMDRAVLDTRA